MVPRGRLPPLSGDNTVAAVKSRITIGVARVVKLGETRPA
jgi:hypothetical protein